MFWKLKQSPPRQIDKRKLRIEWLEDRTVPATLFGDLYYDTNLNSSQDPGEAVASDVEVILMTQDGTPSMSTMSDGNGQYSFTGLDAGMYTFEYVASSGTMLIPPMDNMITITPIGTDIIPIETGLLEGDTLAPSRITFLDYEISPNNTDANLFLEEGDIANSPVIEISVLVDTYSYVTGPPLTGSVIFTAILPNNSIIALGTATIDSNGIATIEVASGIIAQAGLEVEAVYSGDIYYASTTLKDNGNIANNVQADPPVTDNPVIAPNAQNLTVVVVAGNGVERKLWRDSARQYYGANAYIITDVHSIADLGTRLSTLPAGSINKLVIGAHGSDAGAQLGNAGNAPTRLTAANLTNNAPAKQQIINALKPLGLIDLQACSCGLGMPGQVNMQLLADALGIKVRGADGLISDWDDTGVNWNIVTPIP